MWITHAQRTDALDKGILASEKATEGSFAASSSARPKPMLEVLAAFSPNKVVSKNTIRFIIAFEVAVLLIVWATSTYVFLPKPPDVGRAFLDLWAHEGLGQELITSFMLKSQAMAWAT